MKTINQNNLTINGDIFVIPEEACKIEAFKYFSNLEGEKESILMSELCKLNGTEFDPNEDYLFQPWIVSEEYEADDMIGRPLISETDDGVMCKLMLKSKYLPAKLFDGKSEGDMISLKIPVYIITSRSGKKSDLRIGSKEPTIVIAEFNLKLNQTEYRYNIHGQFQEVLDKVIKLVTRNN